MSVGLHTYHGYRITTKVGQAPDYADPEAKVFDPHDKRGAPLFKATSLDAAMKWIDAYVKGEQWAVAAKLVA